MPPARLDVEIERVFDPAATLIVRDAVAVLLLASVTSAVKVEVPDAVGVPEMAPEEAFRVSPAGKDPLLKLHE